MRLFFTLLLVSVLGVSSAFAGSIQLKVKGLESSRGKLLISVHDGADGFPGPRNSVRQRVVKAEAGTMTVTFKNLAPGWYAIGAVHDANSNGKLDMEGFRPTESFGFSRDALGLFGPPSFSNARIKVGAGVKKHNINLRH